MYHIIKKEIGQAYISKYNYKRKKQVILLMVIDDGKKWRYILLREITSEHDGDFYCLNRFSFISHT